MSSTTHTPIELLGARISARRTYYQVIANAERGTATQLDLDNAREAFARAERAYEAVAPRGTAR